MTQDFFSNTVGFLGNTSYSLKYVTNTRNLRYTWPHSNIFARSSDENTLLQSILNQQVGIDRGSTYRDRCSELLLILQKFVSRHAKTDYREVLKKCDRPRFSETRLLKPIPRHVVTEYIHKVVHNVVPLALFGNDVERRTFERNVRQILHLGKAQVFSLNMLMVNVGTKSKTYLRSIEDQIDKSNLAAKLYLWILRFYVFAALKCVFYVTDSNESKQYSFYTKHTWQKIQQRTFNQMKKEILGLYKNCLISRAVRSDDLFILRILPKRRGGRPIFTKWKRVVSKSRFSVPLNRIVRQFFLQLAGENFKYAHNLSNFHERWKTLFLQWTALKKPAVYFVKADFSDAYGSILHTKLLQSIEELMKKQPKYEIEFVYRKRVKRVPVRYIFAVIKDYVTNFVYKHNENVYRLKEGISQGGPLSAILCNFYFGAMDLKHFTEFGEDSSGFLVRNCDDYLYVTLNAAKALKFLNRLSEGFPDFNLKLNDSKTETNIFLNPGALNLVKISTLEVDVNSFQLYRSFHSYQNSTIFHTSFLRTITCPGRILVKRLPLWTELNLKEPFFDPLYNSALTILCNVFQSANLTAARFISFIEVLFQRYNDAFILKNVNRTASQMTASVLRKAKNLGDEVGGALVTWIILKAFLRRFQRTKHRNRCSVIIRRIQSVLLFWRTKFNANEMKFLERLRDNEHVLALGCIL